MKKQLALLAALAIACGAPAGMTSLPGTGFTAEAQANKVSGVIRDAQGEPLIGATVKVKGTNRGTATDVDGNPLLTSKLGYKLFIDCGNGAEPYIFAADNYGFDEDMTVIEYNREDEMNFMKGGQLVVVYNIPDNAKRIGVQSVYTVGTDERASQITWMSFGDIDGITPTEKQLKVVSETFCDLQGRPVSTVNRQGIFITDGKKVIKK
jgi:hypothetical protein